ncbi:MAG: hypothetical protein EP314_08555 [Bacteroidetes bacterium]|nr:MAG: hypothetical protein EP314_08555 [Bacteroidota bacterium]
MTEGVYNTTFIVMEHWMLVGAYAQACGVPYYPITKRIEKGKLSHVRIDGEYIINAQISPPVKTFPRKWSKPPAFPWPEGMPSKDELVWVTRFVRKQKMRSDALYRAILFGEIPAWGVSGRVLVRKADALAIARQ